MYAVKMALEIDKTSAEARDFVSQLLTFLEHAKKDQDHRFQTEAEGLAHVQKMAYGIFAKVYEKDLNSDFSK